MRLNAGDSILDNIGVAPGLLAAQLERYVRRKDESELIVLVGCDEYSNQLFEALAVRALNLRFFKPSEQPLTALGLSPAIVIYCQSHFASEDWERAITWETTFGTRFTFLWTLMRDVILMSTLGRTVAYFRDIDETLETYRSTSARPSPIVQLNKTFPVRGKRVIEFGCLEGAQTAGLVNLGALEITCVEFRPENYIKAALAKVAYNWNNVHLVLEPFQFVNCQRFGSFDICLFHGVYYHTNQPFLLFRNAASLAPVIFFGGFVASEHTPPSSWITLSDGEHLYRATKHQEFVHMASGVSQFGYFFSTKSLLDWFTNNRFDVVGFVAFDVNIPLMPQRYVRFVATKQTTNCPVDLQRPV